MTRSYHKTTAMKNASLGFVFAQPSTRYKFLAEELQKLGYAVNLYDHSGSDPIYKSAPYSPILTPLYLLKNTNHDLYITSRTFIPSAALYINWLLRKKRYLYVLAGDPWVEFFDRAFSRKYSQMWHGYIFPIMLEKIIRGASAVITNSIYMRNQFLNYIPFAENKLFTVYNGIDHSYYRAGKPIQIEGAEPTDPILAFVISCNVRKKTCGIKLVLEAMGIIVHQIPKAKLLFCVQSEKPYLIKEIKNLVASSEASNSIQFFLNYENIPDILAGADLFIYSTMQDSLPRALIEAQTAGLAAVSINSFGCSEIVVHNETGLLVDYDKHLFAQACIDLLQDQEKRGKFGKAAKIHAEEKFNWKDMAHQFSEIFQEVL